MAIEDAVSIARLLPADTTTSEVEERAKLYEEIRYKRAEYVREQTRRNGLDEEERSLGGFFILGFFHLDGFLLQFAYLLIYQMLSPCCSIAISTTSGATATQAWKHG
jgi:2-polyprenyl-6-methoxyphenol hydroxylase-like FAD-dependent oxidoreductase